MNLDKNVEYRIELRMRNDKKKAGFEERYAGVFRDLGRPLRERDSAPESVLKLAEARLGIDLPRALRAFYRVAGRATDFNAACDRFFPPDEWTIEDNHLIFVEESQAVVLYGIRIDQQDMADPPVFMTSNGPKFRWFKVSESVSEFASVYMLWNGTFGGAMDCVGSALATSGISAKLRREWSYVGEVNRMRAYSQPGRAACYLKWSDGWRIFVGTTPEKEMDRLVHQLGIELQR